jgi:hypothetical protein
LSVPQPDFPWLQVQALPCPEDPVPHPVGQIAVGRTSQAKQVELFLIDSAVGLPYQWLRRRALPYAKLKIRLRLFGVKASRNGILPTIAITAGEKED